MIALLLSLVLAAPAKPTKPPQDPGQQLAARVQRYYAKAKDFSASFSQTYEYVSFGRTEQREGRVLVKKPGLLRWEYDKPEKKLIVLDGKALWTYAPEDQAVLVNRNFKGSELSSAFTFLWGKGDLTKEFTPQKADVPKELPAGEGLLLTPKKEGGSVQKLLFSVGKDGQVLASVVTDSQGNVNTLVFKDAKVDPKLDPKLFTFTPPPDAHVQELGAK